MSIEMQTGRFASETELQFLSTSVERAFREIHRLVDCDGAPSSR